MRVVGRKLFVHPSQVEKPVDLSNQMICRHHLVQIKRIKELTLPAFPPTHHAPLPRESLQITESWVNDRLNESFTTHSGVKRTCSRDTLLALLFQWKLRFGNGKNILVNCSRLISNPAAPG